MATIDEVKSVIARITHSSEDSIKSELTLKDVKADSLHWVQIIVAIETACNVEIDFDKLKELKTVGDFADYIDNMRS
ncbi:MAG: phosphopantetheine-binding protein [Chloroflexi bacterium]|nr:phosphopantetheine-binding protein [Chloroflexota bacterium]